MPVTRRAFIETSALALTGPRCVRESPRRPRAQQPRRPRAADHRFVAQRDPRRQEGLRDDDERPGRPPRRGHRRREHPGARSE